MVGRTLANTLGECAGDNSARGDRDALFCIAAHGKPYAIAVRYALVLLTAHASATDLLCMMTDAKHRARSARGARGSNPSQKTPRQRGEFIPSRRKRAFCA